MDQVIKTIFVDWAWSIRIVLGTAMLIRLVLWWKDKKNSFTAKVV